MENRGAADAGGDDTRPVHAGGTTAPVEGAKAPADPVPATPTAPIDPAATVAMDPPRREARFPYQPGDVILPGYRLTRLLGRGGFGEVWRAEAPGGMGVAIKILANLGKREGGREFRALQTIRNIRHAHIVPLFGVWLKTRDGHVLDGGEVAEAERRILSVPGAAAPAADGADGLESLELIVAMGLGDQTLFDRLKEARRAGHDNRLAIPLVRWKGADAREYLGRLRVMRECVEEADHCGE